MALTFTEMQAITDDYFIADNKKAQDIYFTDSFLMYMFMNQKMGVWERPSGGRTYRIPLEYDGEEGGFYTRGQALSSDSKETINAAYFYPKHAYGNATIYRADEQECSGEYAEVQLVTTKIAGAQKTCRKKIAAAIYGNNTDTDASITGLTKCCFGSSSIAYGSIAEDDLAASDGTKPWKAVNTTSAAAIGLAVIRTLRSSAKISDGAGGKPDVGVTTETLFNIISGILQVQQRFTENKDVTKAGFTNLVFEGMTLSADDYVPSGYLFALNKKHYGWAIHSDGYFVRTPWGALDNTPGGVAGKTMKIYWDGNQVVTNRKAHAGQSGLS